MRPEPIEINLASVAILQEQPRRRASAVPYFVPQSKHMAPPEAFDEIFATLAHKPLASPGETSELNAVPALKAEPLIALSANLERQHERIAALLREIDAATSL